MCIELNSSLSDRILSVKIFAVVVFFSPGIRKSIKEGQMCSYSV